MRDSKRESLSFHAVKHLWQSAAKAACKKHGFFPWQHDCHSTATRLPHDCQHDCHYGCHETNQGFSQIRLSRKNIYFLSLSSESTDIAKTPIFYVAAVVAAVLAAVWQPCGSRAATEKTVLFESSLCSRLAELFHRVK